MAGPQTASTADGQQDGGGIVERVKEAATARLTTQKDRGTDALGRVADAVRSSTQKLREDRHETIASYVDKAADQIETWSRRLSDKDVGELAAEAQRLARRQPAVFIGSAFALGLVAARFLKSSRIQDDYGYGVESRRTRYGRDSGPSRVHDSSDGDRSQERAATRKEAVSETYVASVTPTASGSEGGTRSSRGRRTTSRTERP
jgi:hypothetical protein